MNVAHQHKGYRDHELRAASKDSGRPKGRATATPRTTSSGRILIKLWVIQADSQEHRENPDKDQSKLKGG